MYTTTEIFGIVFYIGLIVWFLVAAMLFGYGNFGEDNGKNRKKRIVAYMLGLVMTLSGITVAVHDLDRIMYSEQGSGAITEIVSADSATEYNSVAD